jgi:predicted NACHT family NTPase
MDWLVVWGVTQVTGALVKPVLEDFAKDVVNDSAKDYVKNCFGNVFKSLQKDAHEKALGKTIKELAQLIDDQLCDAGVPTHRTEAWANDAKEFVRSKAVQTVMRQAFESSASTVDGVLLEQGWPSTVTARLPVDFDWEIVAKTFSKRLKNLRANDSDLRQIYEAQAIGEIAESNRQMAGIVPGFDLNAYRRSLLRQYQRLQLQSLDPYSDRIAQLRSVFVEQNVRECQEYAPQLLTLPKETRRRFLEQSGDGKWNLAELEARQELVEERLRSYHSQSSRPVFEVVGDPRAERMVILGDPGSGKSSLLRYLALQWAEKQDDAVLRDAPVILLIELRDYAVWPRHEGKSFLRYLHEGPTFHRFNELEFDRYLKSASNTVLLLDGLDEIFDEDQRKWALNDLQRFTDDYRNVRITLTSRVIGYEKSQQRLTEMGFSHFMLQDLEDDQIKTFLQRWHQETFTDERDRRRKLTQLDEAIQRTRAIRELAGNPLLLTLMAILNRQQELPRDRARLYERSAQLLLLDWKTELLEERFPELKQLGIGFEEKAAMLRSVAHQMQTAAAGERGNIIARQEIEKILRDYLAHTLLVPNAHGVADALVDQLRGQNFILCDLGNNHYAFVHRTFLEYFCAEAFVQRFEASLDLDFLRDQVFKPHWNDESWHETLCLVAGVIGKKSPAHVAQLVEFLLAQTDPTFEFHHLFLAARCCAELRNHRTLGKTSENTLAALEAVLRFDFPYFYEVWDDEAEQRDRLLAKTVASLINTQLLDQPANWLKDRAARDDNESVRQAAVRDLARSWKDDPDTLLLLKERAAKDDNWSVREAALQELARGWKDDPDTLSLLKDWAANDDDGSARQAALQELARGWKDDPGTLPLLKERAAKDDSESVLEAALQELARGWKDDPDTLACLLDRAVMEESLAGDGEDRGYEYSVRDTALTLLAQYWPEHPETLPLLRSRQHDDPTPWLREKAERLADEIEARRKQ